MFIESILLLAKLVGYIMRHKGKTKTAEALKEAFWKLYSEKDIDKIKICEITDVAGFNRGVFYSYYKNIYEIYNIIERDTMQKIKELSMLMQSFIMDSSSSDKLALIIDIYNKHEKYLKVLFTKDDNPRFMVRMKKMLKENLLNEYKKKNSVVHKTTGYYIEFYVSGMLSLLIYWCINSEKLSIDEFAELLKTLVKTEPVNMLKQIYGRN